MTDFGMDVWCVEDLDPAARDLDASRTLVGQALARRLLTPRGGLLGSPDYGYDVASWLCRAVDARALRQISAECRAEVMKDERVLGATVDVSTLGAPGSLKLTLRINVETAEDAFSYVLTVDGVTVEFLEA